MERIWGQSATRQSQALDLRWAAVAVVNCPAVGVEHLEEEHQAVVEDVVDIAHLLLEVDEGSLEANPKVDRREEHRRKSHRLNHHHNYLKGSWPMKSRSMPKAAKEATNCAMNVIKEIMGNAPLRNGAN